MARQTCESKFHSYNNRGIGSGAFAHVFEACTEDNNCNYVVKLQDITGISDLTQINNTIQISTMMGEVGIGPRIYDVIICDNPKLSFEKTYMDYPLKWNRDLVISIILKF